MAVRDSQELGDGGEVEKVWGGSTPPGVDVIVHGHASMPHCCLLNIRIGTVIESITVSKGVENVNANVIYVRIVWRNKIARPGL